MNTQLMTLEQAIERRIAEIRQAEEERERQIQEEARRMDEKAQRAAVYSKCATFVDAAIYAGGRATHD